MALDLGGTNFRVILAELHAGSRSVRMKCHKHEVSGNTFLICILAVGVVVVLGVVVCGVVVAVSAPFKSFLTTMCKEFCHIWLSVAML